jgi:hypothetical protein
MKSLLQLSLMNVVLAIFCLVAFTVGINFGMHKNLQLGPHKHEPFNFAAQHHHPDHHDVDGNGGKHMAGSDTPDAKEQQPQQQPPSVPAIAETGATAQPPAPGSVTFVVGNGDGDGNENGDKGFGYAAVSPEVRRILRDVMEDASVLGALEQTKYAVTERQQKRLQDYVAADAAAASLVKERGKEEGKMKPKKSISQYLAGGGEFPVVLLTCNRPELLDGTLHSLLQVKGVSKANLMVMQDGQMKSVTQVANKYGLVVHRNAQGINLRGGVPRDGAARIASHYKFSLGKAFEEKPDAPAIIIVEDDLLFSPDFYEYFKHNAEVLEEDPSLFILSAWNDNGFRGKVRDPFALQRTEYFPGLGWLLPRELWERELASKWPRNHWDHWLRSYEINKGREIAYPQVPRTFHNGIKGTFMDLSTHNRYFRDIDYNRRPIDWSSSASARAGARAGAEAVGARDVDDTLRVTRAVYDARIAQTIKRCSHVNTPEELFGGPNVYCMWLNLDPEPPQGMAQEFESVGSFFGLWHEHRRGAHRGVHEFYWHDSYVLVLNLYTDRRKAVGTNFGALKPASAVIVNPGAFRSPQLKALKLAAAAKEVTITAAKDVNVDCDALCASVGLDCGQMWFETVNDCSLLQQHFPCKACEKSTGMEQPAWESTIDSSTGICLLSSSPQSSTCAAKHARTKRLCPCIAKL